MKHNIHNYLIAIMTLALAATGTMGANEPAPTQTLPDENEIAGISVRFGGGPGVHRNYYHRGYPGYYGGRVYRHPGVYRWYRPYGPGVYYYNNYPYYDDGYRYYRRGGVVIRHHGGHDDDDD